MGICPSVLYELVHCNCMPLVISFGLNDVSL